MIELGLLIKAVIIGASLAIGLFSSRYFGNDNQIEETAEKIIESQSGVNVDLSRSSPEAQQQDKSKSKAE